MLLGSKLSWNNKHLKLFIIRTQSWLYLECSMFDEVNVRFPDVRMMVDSIKKWMSKKFLFYFWKNHQLLPSTIVMDESGILPSLSHNELDLVMLKQWPALVELLSCNILQQFLTRLDSSGEERERRTTLMFTLKLSDTGGFIRLSYLKQYFLSIRKFTDSLLFLFVQSSITLERDLSLQLYL